MDSSTVLLRLLADGYEVTALSFDYGQKHKVELERAQSLVDYINNNNQEELENILDENLKRVSKIPEIKSKLKIFKEYFPKIANFVKNSY